MKEFIAALESLKIPYDDHMLQKFEGYMELVLEWNEKVNLTSITDRRQFRRKHYIDSLTCYGSSYIEGAQTIIDVGTGAGFPGVPLAIVYPEKEFLLMDSLNKKIKIVAEMTEKIGITNISVFHGRAEEMGQSKKYREKFDLCLSRAVANLAVLSEYCIPLVKVGGYFAAYKTKEAAQEINSAEKAIATLGGMIEERKSFTIDEFHLEHEIIYIKKIKSTLSKYPRKAGTPGKAPLK
ncbi:MAG: 16S rRNA (guanine(527)-N(7))-methyltransferase RsmG [Anaerovorax sp.]